MTPNQQGMVERVAEAIHAIGGMGQYNIGADKISRAWNDLDGDLKSFYRLRARAALEAMRDPNEAMTEDGAIFLIEHNPAHPIQPFAFWQAMIDAALSEKT